MARQHIRTILLVALGILIFSLLLLNMSDYTPYNKDNVFNGSPSPYEGFDAAESKSESAPEVVDKKEKEMKPLSENFEPIMEQPVTLAYGSVRDAGLFEKFSQVTTFGIEGVNGCVSGGLGTENGSMCLTPELIQLLKTRGGNATGVSK